MEVASNSLCFQLSKNPPIFSEISALMMKSLESFKFYQKFAFPQTEFVLLTARFVVETCSPVRHELH